MSSSPTWLPISPSFGGQGHHLGYYHNIAYYVFIAPLFLIIVAIGYNVAVVFARKCVYSLTNIVKFVEIHTCTWIIPKKVVSISSLKSLTCQYHFYTHVIPRMYKVLSIRICIILCTPYQTSIHFQ